MDLWFLQDFGELRFIGANRGQGIWIILEFYLEQFKRLLTARIREFDQEQNIVEHAIEVIFVH